MANEHSDMYCVTNNAGECVSTDPRCMHQPLTRKQVTATRDELIAALREIEQQNKQTIDNGVVMRYSCGLCGGEEVKYNEQIKHDATCPLRVLL